MAKVPIVLFKHSYTCSGYAIFKLTIFDALRMASNLLPSLFQASRFSSA